MTTDQDRAPAPDVAADNCRGAPDAAQQTPVEEFRSTPNAERYILEADALRRRQLETAMVHGSDRTWRERRRIWPAATCGIVAVVIIVMVVAAVGAFHRQQEIAKAKERQQAAERAAAAAAGFPVHAYHGHGLVTNVPSDWKQREARRGVLFTDPKGERWLRIDVVDDGRAARKILQSADQKLALGCCALRYYKWLAVRSAKLGGHGGAEMEYTGVDNHGERRHLVLRVVSVRGLSYQVTMSVPDKRETESQPILDEVARSFNIDR